MDLPTPPPAIPPTANTSNAPMDGLTAPSAAAVTAEPAPPKEEVVKAKKVILTGLLTFYAVYVVWCGILLLLLPSSSGELKSLVSIGVLTSILGACALLAAGIVAFFRISRSKASIALRQRSLLVAAVVVLPGLLLSAFVPFKITQEPPLTIDIVRPVKTEDFVAPVSVTFSVERAADVLKRLGKRPVKYTWDTDGDGKANAETITPSTTMLYERQGNYVAVVIIDLGGGETRRIARRMVIPQAVFSVLPTMPIVEKPVLFSVAHLVTDSKTIKEVTWVFNDSTPPVTGPEVDVAHTFYAVGEYKVDVNVQLLNNTQLNYSRTITVQDPPPLPFPVVLTTDPPAVVGPAPFGMIFTLQTTEALREITWQFGDGKEERGGPDLKRVGHSFDKPGIYPVVVRVRNGSGILAELTTVLKVTAPLTISDLRFEGEPAVQGGKLKGEVPLHIHLTPKTSQPLIEFEWETPAGVDATVTGDTIDAVFRREGTVVLTLIAQNPEGRVLRMPITVETSPPVPTPVISMKPEGGVAPLTVTFDSSESFIPENEEVAGFKWEFGDERGSSQEELTAARVTHTYTLPGEYQVTLRVVMATGEEYAAKRTVVVRRPSLSACIEPSRLRVQEGGGIQFESTCTTGNPSTYLWDVRYDAQPDVVVAQSPQDRFVHVFETQGTYTVSLLIKDQWGNQDKKSVTITVTP